MASSTHLGLSEIIKKVHEDLREKSHLLGTEEAWKSHCSNENNLRNYALAMKELATSYWEPNYNKANSRAISRVNWTTNICTDYFITRIENIRGKENEIAEKIQVNIVYHANSHFKHKWKLLDVGSCYNPFKNFECFEVTAIDIAPANEEVNKCDFLTLDIGQKVTIVKGEVVELPNNYFDVIVFSLLLEYLPSPKQRKLCCTKAYDLLKIEGLLVIITPDSNHVGVNAKLIKSWRFILAEIGFSRIKYEKLPHLHCMAFRKSFSKDITLRWARLHEKEQLYKDIFIPQDFKVKPTKHMFDNIMSVTNEAEALSLIQELPYNKLE